MMKAKQTAISGVNAAMASRAFTMIELLVTISIIAVLAALLMASINKAMDSSRAAECTNNLRQIGAAFMLYLPDNNNVMPQRVYEVADPSTGVRLGYDELLAAYTEDAKRIFRCPSHPPKDFLPEPSYGMNWYYDNANVHVVENLSGTILAAETLGVAGMGSHRADRDSEAPGQIAGTRHTGKSNFLFFDGHIERLSYAETLAPLDRWGEDQEMHNRLSPEAF